LNCVYLGIGNHINPKNIGIGNIGTRIGQKGIGYIGISNFSKSNIGRTLIKTLLMAHNGT